MGSPCTIQFHALAAETAAIHAAVALSEAERIEKKYSRYLPTSVMSEINRAGLCGGSIVLDDETTNLLNFAFACWQRSDGLFDITSGVLRQAWNFSLNRLPQQTAIDALLPLIGMDKLDWSPPVLRFTVPGMELDLGGIGKEYAVDQLACLLTDQGVRHALIDLGGDLRALGPRPDGSPWQIGLRNPVDGTSLLGIAELADGALATSGDYERFMLIDGRRYCHVINPRTGWSSRGLSSVTVLAEQCMVAGSLSTIALLKESSGGSWLSRLDVAHHWIDESGNQGGTIRLTKS